MRLTRDDTRQLSAPCASAPFLELSSFLRFLEQSGRLRRVTKSVDKDWEVACIARWAMECTAEKDAYAILFEHVQNHTMPVVVNLFSTPDIYASALGIPADQILEHWTNALERPRQPTLVPSAPVQEILHLDS